MAPVAVRLLAAADELFRLRHLRLVGGRYALAFAPAVKAGELATALQ